MRILPRLAITTLALTLAACGHTTPSRGRAPAFFAPPTSAATTPPPAARQASAKRRSTIGHRSAKERPAAHQKPLLQRPFHPATSSDPMPRAASPTAEPITNPAAAQALAAPAPTVEHCALPEAGPAVGFYAHDERPADQVALTFDDGPHPSHTPKVLDLLRKHDLHATFFVVGAAIRPGTYHLIQRMVVEGHVIGTHSYNHDIEMASRRRGRRTVDYVRGQHEVTRMLIDLALLAQSEDDFVRVYQRVFERKNMMYMSSGLLRQWPRLLARHRLLLAEAGYHDGERPYQVLYSRPPGGGPYLGLSETWQRQLNDTALREAGLVNVMWHDESGDTNSDKRRDFTFLTNNLHRGFKRGGVVLIHDYIRGDALHSALTALAKTKTQVVPLAYMVKYKYQCDEQTLRAQLRLAP